MSLQRTTPFFAELGKMLNMIRSISAELNEETMTEINTPIASYNFWHVHNTAVARLKTRLQQLEMDIAYFFTEEGCKKTIDNRLNTPVFRHKFIRSFRLLANDYFNLKTGHNNDKYSGNENASGLHNNISNAKTLKASMMI